MLSQLVKQEMQELYTFKITDTKKLEKHFLLALKIQIINVLKFFFFFSL